MGIFNFFGTKLTYEYNGDTKTTNRTKFVSSGHFVEDQRIGLEFEKIKDYHNAIKAYNNALKLAHKKYGYPHPPNIYERLSIIYRELGLIDLEIDTLQKGIRNTNSPQAKTGHRWLVNRLSKIKKGGIK